MARCTILLVEDEPEIRALAAATLHEAGHGVIEAVDGADAIRLFELHAEIDVVFTDIVMTGIDGFKLADIAKLRRPGVRILYATGFVERARDHLGIVHGPILPKPYRPSQLAAAIAAMLAEPVR
jgi:CheY-like chemotaxis protein